MDPLSRQARRAGGLYLLAGLMAPLALIYVPAHVVVAGDATATANHLRASEFLIRAGITIELVSAVLFLLVVLALERLLRRVDEGLAQTMVWLFAVSVPIAFVNVLNEVAALALAQGAPYLSVIEPTTRDALALLFMRLHGQGLVLEQIFWGLWLFPFGRLVMQSGFLSRWLGAWLIVNGASYLVLSGTSLLAPRYSGTVRPFCLPLLLGEFAMVVWLIVVGAKPQKGSVTAGR